MATHASHAQQHRPPRHVTTAVLFDPAINKALLLKRSSKVNTYQHHWAFVSGGMEENDPTPEFRARTEVNEETQLVHESDYSLQRSGRPQKIIDENNGTLKFIVHPFLFHLSPGARERVKLDWEHEGFEWTLLQDVRQRKTVPDLASTILRVWVPEKLAQNLDALKEDRTLGAQEMLRSAVGILKLACLPEMIAECTAIAPIQTKEAALDHLVNVAYLIRSSRPGMSAAMGNAMASILAELRSKLPQLGSAEEVFDAVPGVVDRQMQARVGAQQKLIETFTSLALGISRRLREGKQELGILTHSASSTILQCLLHLAQKSTKSHNDAKVPLNLHVFITESRPLFEAFSLASQLAQSGVRTTLITDASALYLMRSNNNLISMVALGSDQLLPPSHKRVEGGAVNKVGSAMIALAARYCAVPVYIVSSVDKLSDSEPHSELNSITELEGAWPGKLEKGTMMMDALNPYFEEVPGEFVAGFVTERGVLDAEGLQREWDGMRRAEEVWEL